MRGSITRLVKKQGFGFILGEDGCEVYFERTGLNGLDIAGLSVGKWVEYEIQYGFERLRAVNVKTVGGGEASTRAFPAAHGGTNHT